ncbi:MAG: hypothetical protein JXR53_13730 [Bacteroidales bacterium]|nr:hypothetical protein [Bacteroidales bacterium]
MKNEGKNNIVDQVSKDKLDQLQFEAPDMFFKKIRKRVAWYSIFSLGLGSFVRSYWYVAVATMVILFAGRYFLLQDGLHNTTEANNKEVSKNYSSLDTPQKTQSDDENIIAYLENNNQTNPVQQYTNTRNSDQASVSDNSSDESIQASINNPITSNNATNNNGKENLSDVNFSKRAENLSSDVGVEAPTIADPLKMPILFKNINYLHAEELLSKTKVYSKTPFAPQYSLGVSIGTGYSSPLGTFETEFDFNRKPLFSNILMPEISFRMEFQHFFLSTGMRMYSSKDVFNEDPLLFNEHLAETYNLTQQYYDIDTNAYWYYIYVSDSVVHVVDSAWVVELDSNLVQVFDTVIQTGYDTLAEAQWQRKTTLFEIPIMFGKKFNLGNHSLAISAGIGTAFVLKSEGKVYSGLQNSQPFTEISSQTNSLEFSFLMNVSYEYFIHERMSIQIQPYFRKKLMQSTSGSESGLSSDFSTGLSGGIRIYF